MAYEKRAKRYIIEVKSLERGWRRSVNLGLAGHFTTKEEAQNALATGAKSQGMEYRIRTK